MESVLHIQHIFAVNVGPSISRESKSWGILLAVQRFHGLATDFEIIF